jgi:hypothetical protein
MALDADDRQNFPTFDVQFAGGTLLDALNTLMSGRAGNVVATPSVRSRFGTAAPSARRA